MEVVAVSTTIPTRDGPIWADSVVVPAEHWTVPPNPNTATGQTTYLIELRDDERLTVTNEIVAADGATRPLLPCKFPHYRGGACDQVEGTNPDHQKQNAPLLDLSPYTSVIEVLRSGEARPIERKFLKRGGNREEHAAAVTGSAATADQAPSGEVPAPTQVRDYPEYAVNTASDILVLFDKTLARKNFAGQIGVRARILRSTPVELPVDNFTIVNNNELKQESPAQFPDYLLRDSLYTRDMDRLLQEIERNRQPLMMQYYSVASRSEKASYAYRTAYVPPTEDQTRVAKALEDQSVAAQALLKNLDALSQQVELAYSSQSSTSATSDVTFDQVACQVYRLQAVLSAWATRIRATSTVQPAADCRIPAKGTSAPAAAPEIDSKCVDTYIRGSLSVLKSVAQLGDFEVLDNFGPEFKAKCRNRTVVDVVRLELSDIRSLLIWDYRAEFEARLFPRRVSLASTDVKHGEIVEVTVSNRVPELVVAGTAISRDATKTRDYVARYRLRVVSDGFDYRVAPQLVLVKRLEGPVSREQDVPANFAPAPGVAFTVRYRTRERWSEWVLPSVGILASLPRFRADSQFELGIGAIAGLANDLIHVGLGWNVTASDKRAYLVLALDFAQAFGVFGEIFNKSPEVRTDTGTK